MRRRQGSPRTWNRRATKSIIFSWIIVSLLIDAEAVIHYIIIHAYSSTSTGSQGVPRMRSEIDEAIALLKCGGDGALDRAVDLLQGAVFAFSMRVCAQQQDAEDTMQEVLVKSLPYLSKFDNSRALASWLYK